ncbi:DUF6639 family protein [Poseidonocella sp. HB161398]|uniref:DUF6639 family protein n=1 Tax=Poseidonocella sp. HB161398 TaxID=2320855 RepID=UPI0011082AE4|nr:DUF6639 family protein [Poseidonocella sp. HB161398]
MRGERRRKQIAGAALAAATILPGAAAAADGFETCADPAFLAEEGQSHGAVCAAAMAAGDSLETCGMDLSAPVEIETADSLAAGRDRCLASYDCTLGRIRILAPDLLAGHLPPGDAYAALPVQAAFRSLLAHELVHALIAQRPGGAALHQVDEEYIADALELAALGPDERAAFLAAAGPGGEITLSWSRFAPRRFAAAAWRHFAAHGCGAVRDILAGRFSFQRRR